MASVPVIGNVLAVTGGLGFIGRRLVHRLASEGAARVIVVDAGGSKAAAELSTLSVPVEVFEARLGETRPDRLQRLLDGATGLFHLAAEKHADAHDRPEDILVSNVLGT